jgi:catechol 2,3-dioxygenase-like lactoylglutathione lyase family enzyme
VQPGGIHHVAVSVDDADAALAFYQEVLGLTPVPRPDGTRGAGGWFDAGGEQVHLFQPGNAAVAPPHFAIRVDDLGAAIAAIREHGVQVYEVGHVPGFGYQAFVQDPSGNLIELNQSDGD